MIKLKRTVECKTFDVKATIAVGRDRPEFLAVALLANDLDRPISGEDLSEHLFGDIYELGERVLERSVSIGLLEWSEGSNDSWRFAHLSQAGKKAIEQEKVLISEEGVWRFYYLDDPLIRDRLIHFEHVEVPKAREERRNLRNREPQPNNSALALEFLKHHQEHTFTSVVDGTPFMLQDISKEGENLLSEKLTLHTKVIPDKKLDITLQGELKSPTRNGEPLRVDQYFDPPEDLLSITHNEVWVELTTQGGDAAPREYGEGNLIVPVPFDERLDTAARNSMRMDMQIPNPDLSKLGLGRFETTQLKGVLIEPDTNEDARQWAKWLLMNSMDDYKIPELIWKDEQEIHRKFPNHQIQPIDPSDLLEEACASTDKTWSRFLLAPYDLNLWRQQ